MQTNTGACPPTPSTNHRPRRYKYRTITFSKEEWEREVAAFKAKRQQPKIADEATSAAVAPQQAAA